MKFNLNSFLINFVEASSDVPTLFKKVANPSLVSFILCKNLKSFAQTDQGQQISKIIDVGANEGQFAFMARYCWQKVQIDCFEPDPLAFKLLEANHKKDPLMQFFNCALGEKEGELSLNLGSTSAQNSFLIECGQHIKGNVKVVVNTLDHFYSGVDLPNTLLKIDVQGYEMEVLRGGCEVLSDIDFVLIEVSLADIFENGSKLDEIWSFMRGNKYTYNRVLDQYRNPLTNQIVQMDILFQKKDVSI